MTGQPEPADQILARVLGRPVRSAERIRRRVVKLTASNDRPSMEHLAAMLGTAAAAMDRACLTIPPRADGATDPALERTVDEVLVARGVLLLAQRHAEILMGVKSPPRQ